MMISFVIEVLNIMQKEISIESFFFHINSSMVKLELHTTNEIMEIYNDKEDTSIAKKELENKVYYFWDIYLYMERLIQ